MRFAGNSGPALGLPKRRSLGLARECCWILLSWTVNRTQGSEEMPGGIPAARYRSRATASEDRALLQPLHRANLASRKHSMPFENRPSHVPGQL